MVDVVDGVNLLFFCSRSGSPKQIIHHLLVDLARASQFSLAWDQHYNLTNLRTLVAGIILTHIHVYGQFRVAY